MPLDETEGVVGTAVKAWNGHVGWKEVDSKAFEEQMPSSSCPLLCGCSFASRGHKLLVHSVKNI